MSRRLFAALSLPLLLTAPSLAQSPLGPAFTYQGRLNQNNQPFNGSANLVARLFDVPPGGVPLGSQTLNAVNVSAGLFTVTLNAANEFGPAPFDGAERRPPLLPDRPIRHSR